MKKITLFSFALLALSLASCKKTRTCTCTGKSTIIETQTGAVTSGPTTTVNDQGTMTTSYASIKKKTAKVDCLSTTTTYTTEYTFSGTTTTDQVTQENTCTLK